MNILYIAYSCSPFHGSEDKIGWSVPFECAKKNNVFVITKAEQRKYIEKYFSEHQPSNIQFYYVDIPAVYKKIFKGAVYSGRLNVWHKRALETAREICTNNKIDIIHQITPVEFRSIGDYASIPNVKFVCGPVGGGEAIPKGLRKYASGHLVEEFARATLNHIYRFRFNISRKKVADEILFANYETRDFLIKDKNSRKCYKVYSEIGVDNESVVSGDRCVKAQSDKFVFLVVGRMIYRKGHKLLLDALREIPENFDFECRFIGDGPEFHKLKKICQKDKNLSEKVVFVGNLPHDKMCDQYENADVLIVPSIRETTGTVILEAMSNALPVVALNKFGAAIISSNEAGWLYEGNDGASYVNNLRNAMINCMQKPEDVKQRGDRAKQNAEEYTWCKKNHYYQELYKK